MSTKPGQLQLVGFAVSLFYAIIHKLWLPSQAAALVRAQFYAHQLGAVSMVVGLYLLYSATVPASLLDPVLAISSLAVLAGVLLMLVLVVKAHRAGRSERVPQLSEVWS